MRRVLFASSGGKFRGSWLIRGQQLGHAVGARVVWNPRQEDIGDAEAVVIVKRVDDAFLDSVRARGLPVVLDVVDGWRQPTDNRLPRGKAIAVLKSYIERIKPHAVVCSTRAMEADLGGDWPALTLHHHGRPDSLKNPIRPEVGNVGYEGSERYLEGWWPEIRKQCVERGWLFQVNPTSLADIDIVVSFRGGQWRGYATDAWKSNVKLANAQASGTPIALLPEAGAKETASGGEMWVEKPEWLGTAFSALEPYEARLEKACRLIGAEPKLDDVADLYRGWLDAL